MSCDGQSNYSDTNLVFGGVATASKFTCRHCRQEKYGASRNQVVCDAAECRVKEKRRMYEAKQRRRKAEACN